jgi:hypothetical protein
MLARQSARAAPSCAKTSSAHRSHAFLQENRRGPCLPHERDNAWQRLAALATRQQRLVAIAATPSISAVAAAKHELLHMHRCLVALCSVCSARPCALVSCSNHSWCGWCCRTAHSVTRGAFLRVRAALFCFRTVGHNGVALIGELGAAFLLGADQSGCFGRALRSLHALF